MPGRNFSSNGYRYGFNGKENDNEVKNITGSQQDYGMRIYDPRLGKFLSVDPLTKKYPQLTPYQFSSNSPILFVDIDGMEGRPNPKPSDCPALTNNMNLFLEGIKHGQGQGLADLFTLDYWGNLAASMVDDAPVTVPSIDEIGSQIQADPWGTGNSVGRVETHAVGGFVAGLAVDAAVEIPFMLKEVPEVPVDQENVTLYRGVNENHAGYNEAVQGNTTPKGGTATAEEHNAGNTESPYTSWTTNPEVAKNYALRPKGDGVVLEKTVPKNQTVASPNKENIYLIQSPGTAVSETEVLLQGPIKADKVTPVSKDVPWIDPSLKH